MRRYEYILPIAAMAVACALTCSKDTNPFANSSRAQALIETASFADGDTLAIFTRETLTVAVAVREYVDSVEVEIAGNRLFDTCTTIPVDAANESRHAMVVSFCDTGWQDIIVRTYRTGGDEVHTTWRVYLTSPLGQDPVTGVYDSTVMLRTDSVADDDVLYHWDFGYGAPVQSAYPETLVTIHGAAYSQQGYIWVSDVAAARVSPRVAFPYTFSDTRGPSVVCVNEGFEDRDTVLTGSETFFFRVSITDRGRGGVASAAIDGDAFDIVQDPVYVKIFYDMDQLTGYRAVTVSAVDNPQDNNTTEKRFFIGYDSTMAGSGGGARILVVIPSRDSTVSHVRERYLYGTVENYTGDTIVMGVRVNDATETLDTLSDAFVAQWGRAVYLANDTNSISLTAYVPGGNVLDDTTFTMLFDSTGQDTLPPRIYEITVGGRTAQGLYVQDDTAVVRIIAFDEGSGIASLTVNDSTVQPGGEFGGYVWDVTVRLSHDAAGNDIAVSAQDANGLVADSVVTIFKNSPPVLVTTPSPPYPLVAGETYRDTLAAQDADGDTVRFERAGGPGGLTVGEDGAVAWIPDAADAGTHGITVTMRDNITSVSYSWYITVVDSAFYGNAVTFSVDEQDFPSFLEVDRDSISLMLSLAAGSGTGPFTYRAVRRRGTSYDSIPVIGGMFAWAPAVDDTGYQHFVITVEDKYFRTDTLYPIVLVVPPNREFTSSYTHGVDTLPDGTLDLSEKAAPETLHFHIDDPDRIEVERFSVVIRYRGAEDIRTIEGADSFVVVVDPDGASAGTDTLSVTITDRGGNDETYAIPVYHGSAPEVSLVGPANGVLWYDSVITLSWSGSDANGDGLTYTVYVDTTPDFSAEAGELTDTFYTDTPLVMNRNYYWKVVASDGRFAGESSLGSFITVRR
ncbi:MAG: hypothetical protein GF418_09095, partial [Chitinivibrionales bacterium]|nr:hypothetical protein [Chitinivibrionales bacterium]MBD3395766.1 hypothetical protein [Chitinivibrionales bacterium]